MMTEPRLLTGMRVKQRLQSLLRSRKEVISLAATRKCVVIVVVVALALAMMAPLAWSAPVPSQTAAAAPAADASAVAAERDLIKAKLMDFGLSDKDAASRVGLLTDVEVHAITADLDSLQAAGATSDQKWDTVTVLLLLILVAIIA